MLLVVLFFLEEVVLFELLQLCHFFSDGVDFRQLLESFLCLNAHWAEGLFSERLHLLYVVTSDPKPPLLLHDDLLLLLLRLLKFHLDLPLVHDHLVITFQIDFGSLLLCWHQALVAHLLKLLEMLTLSNLCINRPSKLKLLPFFDLNVIFLPFLFLGLQVLFYWIQVILLFFRSFF